MAKFSVQLQNVGSAHYLLSTAPDMINTHLRQGKVWDPSSLEVSRLLLSHCDAPVVVDVGANLGAYAVPMGQFIAPLGGRLYAFEPQRMVFYQLCSNLFANRLTNCYAFHLAVGAGHGRVDVPVLDVASERNLGALSLDPAIRALQGTLSSVVDRSEKVDMVALSEFDLPPADLVKVDVEGLELQVLQGAHHWLARSGFPPILFEVWNEVVKGFDEHRQRLFDFVQKDLGYRIERLGENCLAQHPQRCVVDVSRPQPQAVALRLRPAPVVPPLAPLRVAVVTPTYGRSAYLAQCRRYFEAQTNVFAALHWFILDDSPQPDPVLSGSQDPRIHYRWVPERIKLGAKRNQLNDRAREWGADIICAMDDDDWYGPDYVSDMARLLLSSGSYFAGSSIDHYYGVWNARIVRTVPGPAMSSCNGVLCYRAEVLAKARYDESAQVGEEASFLGHHPVAQHPDIKRVHLALAHRANTVSKRNYFMLPQCQTALTLDDLPMFEQDRHFYRHEVHKLAG